MLSNHRLQLALLLFLMVHVCAARSWKNARYSMWSVNCRLSGIMLDKRHGGFPDCEVFCARHKKCTHYVWSPLDGGTCTLEKDGGKHHPAQAVDVVSFICGVMAKMHYDFDDEGSDALSTNSRLNILGTTQNPCVCWRCGKKLSLCSPCCKKREPLGFF